MNYSKDLFDNVTSKFEMEAGGVKTLLGDIYDSKGNVLSDKEKLEKSRTALKDFQDTLNDIIETLRTPGDPA